jgi:hypothetical protein
MSNELKDIANKLSGYSDGEGWEIYSAEKQPDGSWNLTIQLESRAPKADQEATNDNN